MGPGTVWELLRRENRHLRLVTDDDDRYVKCVRLHASVQPVTLYVVSPTRTQGISAHEMFNGLRLSKGDSQ
jgi:hypothetical protein